MESTQIPSSHENPPTASARTADLDRQAVREFAAFRRELYGCFGGRKDTLMTLGDALLTDPLAHSLPELSLSPFFARRWPSVYQAFDGSVDRTALRTVLTQHAPSPRAGRRLVLGVDTSGIARPQSATARDRTAQLVHNLPPGKGSPPITYGWSFSAIVVLPEDPSGFVYLLDHLRVESSQTPIQVAAKQLQAIGPLLTEPPLVVGDRHYGSATFVKALGGVACDALLRIPKNRVFYRAAPPPTHRRGHPTWHGTPFKCADASTHGDPDETWEGTDDRGRPRRVDRWNALHFRACRDQPLSVIRVVRPHAADTRRDPRISWFIELRQTPAPPLSLPQVGPTYGRRFGQEHGYRFLKGDLLWDQPRLRTPERFQLWTDLVTVVQDQLVLARPFLLAECRPWEDAQRPVTPRQVRRSMGGFIAGLGTPAAAPQPRGKSPGRPQGFHPVPAPRFPVVTIVRPRPKGPGSRSHSRVESAPTSPPASPTASWVPPAWLLQQLHDAPALV